MLALALYDYMNDPSGPNSYPQLHHQQQQLISFRRGTIIDVLQSNGGWSYGRVVQKPLDEDTSTNSNALSTGWFPTSYVSLYKSPLSAPPLPLNITENKAKSSNVTVVGPDQVETSEDDEGFYGTPMGGYIEPEEVNDNHTPRNSADDDREPEILPPGVATVPVPTRRQLRVITMPKNLVSNIATTTSKVTSRLHRRQNHSSITTRPAVFVSPS